MGYFIFYLVRETEGSEKGEICKINNRNHQDKCKEYCVSVSCLQREVVGALVGWRHIITPLWTDGLISSMESFTSGLPSAFATTGHLYFFEILSHQCQGSTFILFIRYHEHGVSYLKWIWHSFLPFPLNNSLNWLPSFIFFSFLMFEQVFLDYTDNASGQCSESNKQWRARYSRLEKLYFYGS
jgi:hypothetical protein